MDRSGERGGADGRKTDSLASGCVDLLGKGKGLLWMEQRGEGNTKQRCHQGRYCTGPGRPCKYSGLYTRKIGGRWRVLHKGICVMSRPEAGLWGHTASEWLHWD